MKCTFTAFERYAIWKWHEERCWLCREPLTFSETNIDHVFPEELLSNDRRRQEILKLYNLTDDSFNINGYENWLPSHANCNQKKSKKVTNDFIPGIAFILESLRIKAPKVKETVDKLIRNKKTDKIFLYLLEELESGEINFDDLLNFIKPLGEKENLQFISNDLIILSGGYWVHKNTVIREGLCTCERNYCVESTKKIYCYFPSVLSTWVIKKGLYHKCYDEVLICPRCNKQHKRGHIGKSGICDLPYTNQDLQIDN